MVDVYIAIGYHPFFNFSESDNAFSSLHQCTFAFSCLSVPRSDIIFCDYMKKESSYLSTCKRK